MSTEVASSSVFVSKEKISESEIHQLPRGITIPQLSFATDLLFSLDEVKGNCTKGLTTQENLVQMLKSRITLEKQYASELHKMATNSHLEELEHGSTLKEALGKLKAQYLNTSVQHKTLAKSLEEDVLKPIEDLYQYNLQKAQNLSKLTSNIRKQVRNHEDTYRKDHAHFEKSFREASNAFAAAMDAGFSSTLIEQEYHRQMEVSSKYFGSQSSAQTFRHKALAQKAGNNGAKLVSWLLPVDMNKKENLGNEAVKALETAENSRVQARVSWAVVERSRLDMFRAIQSVLTEYQQIAEHRISNLTTNLRKHIVFESSALANEQYDWQMIASKIENVDFEGDIREFILSHQAPVLPGMSLNDLCNTSGKINTLSPTSKSCPCPPKRDHLEIGDLAVRRMPMDKEGNQARLEELLLTRLTVNDKDVIKKADDKSPEASSSQVNSLLRCDTISTTNEKSLQHFPVLMAKDVARAIAKAYEIRAVKQSYETFVTETCQDDASEASTISSSNTAKTSQMSTNNELEEVILSSSSSYSQDSSSRNEGYIKDEDDTVEKELENIPNEDTSEEVRL